MLVTKRAGHEEKFNRKKLVSSLRRAGVPRKTARRIVAEIGKSETETTTEMRGRVVRELRKMDPSLARRYESTRSLAVRESAETVRGTVRLYVGTLNDLGVKRGEDVTLEHRGREKTLVAEAGPVQERWIGMNVSDMKDMRVKEGTRLSVRLQR
ncbi:MAG: ATP cone domain-containing protein [Thermoplasmata archaeon]